MGNRHVVRFVNVVVAIPDDVRVADAKEYIQMELKAAGGCRRPEDPLFEGLEVVQITSCKDPHAKADTKRANNKRISDKSTMHRRRFREELSI